MPTIYFDISDVVEQAQRNYNVSGIQRVQWNVIAHLTRLHGSQDIRCIFWHKKRRTMVEPDADTLFSNCDVDSERLLRKLNLLTFPMPRVSSVGLKCYLQRFSNNKLRRTLKKLELFLISIFKPARLCSLGIRLSDPNLRQIAPITLKDIQQLDPSFSYVILGAGWHFREVINFAAKHQAAGGDVVQLIHDVIPCVCPEYFDPSLVHKFNAWLQDTFAYTSRFICVSQWTAHDLQRLLDGQGHRQTICAIPLAHEFVCSTQITPAAARNLDQMTGSGFILCVGTLEPRKNGVRLLQAWQKLYEKLGEATPRLVFAGKPGWLIQEFMSSLGAIQEQRNIVVIIKSPSDAELAHLYRNCLLSIYPSKYEGWGLPVGESLWFGKHCIASSATSVPEVGQKLVDYVNPDSAEEMASMVSMLISDPAALQERERRIRQTKLRKWEEVAQEIHKYITNNHHVIS